LDSAEHQDEIKRMRAYSKDYSKDDDESARRRRTRSMDTAEENEAITQDEKKLSPDEWRKEHQLTLRGHGENRDMKFPNPYIEFQDAPFSPRIMTSFSRAGFARPSAIQAQAWPLAIAGHDLISIAKTGSGKTCGFLMPVFHHYDQNGTNAGRGQKTKPILLVLAPTRELSVQILEEAQKFGRPLGIRSVCCYGGSPKYPQIAALERGLECIIATPGRLNDLLEMKKADLSEIKYLVLDEADRMLDMVRVCCNVNRGGVQLICSRKSQTRVSNHFIFVPLRLLGFRATNSIHYRKNPQRSTDPFVFRDMAKRNSTPCL
jgi:ATP-dependent RNA helicase DDX5/DBP2